MALQPRRPALQSGQRGLSNLSKYSFHSFATSSFEADDERSDTDRSMSPPHSDPDTDGDDRVPTATRYVGHDARPTSQKELMGWYMYAFAAETYVICGIGKFGLSSNTCLQLK